MEKKNLITFMGNPLTLLGPEIQVGDPAPDFVVLEKDLSEVTLNAFAGNVKVISVTPSLDTPVCDLQAKQFNQSAKELPGDVSILNISVDLPFAISRFCSDSGIEAIKTLSDHREVSFGLSYGLLIKELRLLTRAVIVIDQNDIVQYVEIVPEVTNAPDYDKALEAIAKITG